MSLRCRPFSSLTVIVAHPSFPLVSHHRISDVLGFSRREIISNSFYNLYHVLDADNVLTAIKNRKLSIIFLFPSLRFQPLQLSVITRIGREVGRDERIIVKSSSVTNISLVMYLLASCVAVSKKL